ncbi:hypothetical protein AVEN_164281-1 [Araneus ventricosus]|uniref:GAG-pre-integrase domain-containing protein n=1 Tax=Araneus ventricosus TaxID=182803 RepID=A0A4Y2GX71_ARAVE|nr:hypothetical protein AVEN_164281-1 [Araneus ventricosus]
MLLSEGVIVTKGMKIIKMHDYADIYNCKNELVGTAVRFANNLYHMLFRTVTYPEVNISHKNNLKIWHERTGHINLKALCELSERGLIEKLDVSNKEDFFCEGCQYGKQHIFPSNPREYKATKRGELIYSDICGPMSVQSVGIIIFPFFPVSLPSSLLYFPPVFVKKRPLVVCASNIL